MQKPVPTQKEYYYIMEIFDYVQEKYNLDVIFMDFWHWFVMEYEPDNQSFVTLSTEQYDSDDIEIKRVKEKLEIEYGEEIPLYVTY